MYTTLSTKQISAHNIIVANVGSATASFKDLVTVAREKSTNQTAMFEKVSATVSKAHQQNSRVW